MRADAARNRARVLAAAEELFAEQGADAQLLDIARRAGVGAGTVYRHFPTKEALFAEVAAARLNDLLDEAVALAAGRDPGEAFLAFWVRATQQACRNAAICEAFTSSTGQELRVPVEIRERFLRTFADMLSAAQRVGAIRADVDAEDGVALLSAAVLADQRRADSAQPGRLARIIANAMRPEPS